MSNTNNTEDHKQIDIDQNKKIETMSKIYVKQPYEILKDLSSKNTNDDVQRAIEGLKEIPDEELQEFLNDEDFMEGLDVVDAWEGDEERNRENEHATTSAEQEEMRSSREYHRPRERKGSYNREKPKREEKKREEILRRDPAKSTKDIERDKIRTKRDTESKLLAEKEKAIKHLLDSDNVVPPGTETEAIQSITEKQNMERAQQRERRSRERRRSSDRYGRLSSPRRRTPDKLRPSPHRRRSPFMSPERRRSPFSRASVERHRSPFKYSPGKRRNSPRYVSDRRSPNTLSPDRRRSPRRLSWERRSSIDRRWSVERHRRRSDMHERRRSRSHDRRSRSLEHPRRRSSRSPTNRRYSPRRRSRTRSRSPPEKRTRKRSPFINELARQLRNEAMIPTSNNYATSTAMEQIAPLLNAPVYQQETDTSRPPLAPPYMHQPGPPPPPAPVLPMQSVPPTFMNFEIPVTHMTFETPMAPHTLPPADYSSGPIIYNQPNNVPIQPPPSLPVIRAPLPASVTSPQPVPAPAMDHGQIIYNPPHVVSSVQPSSSVCQFESTGNISNHSTTPSSVAPTQSYKERRPTTPYNAFHAPHEERLKTPEPPVISKPKHFEKTSLSSLLEASVSAKDPSNIPVLYPGFKPEIMRHCEQALCQLPLEDPRLKMKGRFFFVREEEDVKNDSEDHTSNSILLQKGKTKIYWEETAEQPIPIAKPAMQTHQKICQTDELETETKGVQVTVTMVDFESQVYPHDLQSNKEEKRPIMDRLDWNVQETYDYTSRFREVEDLRWSLNNSSQRRSWNRPASLSRREEEQEHRLESMNHGSRNLRLDSPSFRSKESYSGQKVREHYSRTRYSPDYRRSMERDEFHDRRSDHSRGESPMELEDSDDEIMTGHTFQRGSDWHGRGRTLRGKSHILRGKHSGGRPYRSRGGFRGKF